MRPMTRTQTRPYGVIAPSSRQLLLEAMLCVFACLLSNVGSMLATIFNRHTRDWHTDAASEDQLQTSNDIAQKEPQLSQPSFSGKAEGRIPGIPVASSRGTTTYSPEAHNQDARHRAEHDTVVVAALRQESGSESKGHAFPATCLPKLEERRQKAGIQSARKARSPLTHPLPSFRAKAHRAVDPETRSHTHRQHAKSLDSGSRASRASGMTMVVRQVRLTSA